MSAATRLRVALVGCGRIAHVHCAYLRQLAPVELAGACDINRESRQTLTARWQVPTYADVEELLEPTCLKGSPLLAVSAVTRGGLPPGSAGQRS